MRQRFRIAATVAGLLLATGAFAQDEDESAAAPANDQADVWAIVEAQWSAEANEQNRWHEKYLTEDFSGWGKNSPAPRSRTSTMMWDRYTDKQGSLEEYELYPLAIVVHDDVAVAHYLYSSAYEDKDGESEITNGRYTDVLVRTDDGWKFLAWHGGGDED